MTPTLRRLVAAALGAIACAALPGHALAAKAPLTTETEQAFWKGDFAALDKQNEFLKHGKHFTPDAGSELEHFRLGLGSVIRTRVDRSEPYLRELEALTLQWATEHPKSSLAHILHAEVLVQHAWSYRGGGYAKDVPPAAWADFHKYLQRAADYLKAHADVALADSSAHALLLRIGTGLEWDNGSLRAIQQDGLKRNPDDVMLYFGMLTPLLPKWGGDPETLDRYIRQATKQTQADYGMGMYARLYAQAADEDFGHKLFENSLADWATMKKGYEDMQARFPNSPGRRSHFAHMACLAKDRPTLVALLAELGPKIDVSQWGPNPQRSLESCQRWAQESPGERKDGAKPEQKGRANPASL
ncbi:DUF4034 domain-containing protein [Massilia phosphatilytica]|nr:DUF4034 domain-containing protein [Massilia phosphatilytica]